MVEYFGTEFEVASATLVILDRAGLRTWGVEVKCLPTPTHTRAPKFTLHGLPLPAGGIEEVFGQRISFREGESTADNAPQALIYVWDWSAANENSIAVERSDQDGIRLSWNGECCDPDAYDARARGGTFKIDCICQLSYET